MQEDLTQHPNAGVRWQAQMEEHLTSVRTLTSEALMVAAEYDSSGATRMSRASLAQAHATAALALALSNAGGDLESVLSRIAERA